jgi:hypothetical protein
MSNFGSPDSLIPKATGKLELVRMGEGRKIITVRHVKSKRLWIWSFPTEEKAMILIDQLNHQWEKHPDQEKMDLLTNFTMDFTQVHPLGGE